MSIAVQLDSVLRHGPIDSQTQWKHENYKPEIQINEKPVGTFDDPIQDQANYKETTRESTRWQPGDCILLNTLENAPNLTWVNAVDASWQAPVAVFGYDMQTAKAQLQAVVSAGYKGAYENEPMPQTVHDGGRIKQEFERGHVNLPL
jgi:hypothetical protein